eukprot:1766701-Rhodomonas_salina.1
MRGGDGVLGIAVIGDAGRRCCGGLRAGRTVDGTDEGSCSAPNVSGACQCVGEPLRSADKVGPTATIASSSVLCADRGRGEAPALTISSSSSRGAREVGGVGTTTAVDCAGFVGVLARLNWIRCCRTSNA